MGVKLEATQRVRSLVVGVSVNVLHGGRRSQLVELVMFDLLHTYIH